MMDGKSFSSLPPSPCVEAAVLLCKPRAEFLILTWIIALTLQHTQTKLLQKSITWSIQHQAQNIQEKIFIRFCLCQVFVKFGICCLCLRIQSINSTWVSAQYCFFYTILGYRLSSARYTLDDKTSLYHPFISPTSSWSLEESPNRQTYNIFTKIYSDQSVIPSCTVTRHCHRNYGWETWDGFH